MRKPLIIRPKTKSTALLAITVYAASIAGFAFARGATRIQIKGNHPAELTRLRPLVHADSAMKLQLIVMLGIHDQAKLDELIADQQNPSSTQYHRWLTPQEFNQRFGPTMAQTDAVVQWLTSEGFQVTSVNRLGRTINATASVSQVEAAFAVSIVTCGANFGNTVDPSVPAEFERVIVGIEGLDNMHAVTPAGLHRTRPSVSRMDASNTTTLALADMSQPGAGEAGVTIHGATLSGSTAFGPFDVETFYDETPLIAAGNSGTVSPDCVALDEDSDYLDAAVSLFASTFRFPPFDITRVLPSGSSPDINDDESEALLDIDYAHAAAPATPIHVYVDSVLYTSIQKSVTDNVCGAISISFIYCSSSSSFFIGLDTLFAQAATQGQSVFVGSGDWGAAGLQYDSTTNSCVIGTTANANEMAASPHVTGVGGTAFSPQYDSSGSNISAVGVAPGGIESGWDRSGGGTSRIFSKPAWQAGVGVPDDSARDVPDVSMIAWTPGVFVGADSNGTPVIQCCWGGTSLAAPLWAGYSRVLANQHRATRLGLINPRLYSLAQSGLLTNGIEDVTSGNNSYNGVIGYNAGVGYDQVTGWGSVDMSAFALTYDSTQPWLRFGPTPLSFASTVFGVTGATSAPAQVHLKNTVTSPPFPITLEGIKFVGPNSGDFTIQSSDCPKVLAPGLECFLNLTFTPTALGLRTARLKVFDDAGNQPQVFWLSGHGVRGRLRRSATELFFGKVTKETGKALSVTLANPESVPLSITLIAVKGADASEFSEIDDCIGTLVGGNSCTVTVSFYPTRTGLLTGAIRIHDDARDSPQSIQLQGTGM